MYTLIDLQEGGIGLAYGPFENKEEAMKYAATLEYYYGDFYDPEKPPPDYTDQDLFDRDWAVVKLTEPDWEQFGK